MPAPPPLKIEKQKKKMLIRANFKLFHPYFATFLVTLEYPGKDNRKAMYDTARECLRYGNASAASQTLPD